MPRRYDRRAVLRRGALAVGLAAPAGCLGSGSSSPRVAMTGAFRFDPETVSAAAGATVRWENTSDVGHTVTAYADRIPDGADYFASGGFDSERAARTRVTAGLIAPGETYEHTVGVAGTYEYFCVPHEGSGMVGSVEVG